MQLITHVNPLKDAIEFTFNPKLGRPNGGYINEKGQRVPELAVRQALAKVISGAEEQMVQIGRDLIAGDITGQKAYLAVRQKAKLIKGLSAAMAKGGIERMTASDWGAIGPPTKEDYKAIDAIFSQIKSGEMPLDGRFTNALRAQAKKGNNLYHKTKKLNAKSQGFGLVKNVLGQGEHCKPNKGRPGCPEETARGAVPIDEMSDIGDRACWGNCTCHLVFMKGIDQPAISHLSEHERIAA